MDSANEASLTASNIVKAISNLPKNRWFEYIAESTTNKVRVVSVTMPEGPIVIERSKSKKRSPISTAMVWRIANAFQADTPINFDRVLGASYNTRSTLETLLAHTPEFYWCKPKRIELADSTQKIKDGHKHLVWRPQAPHKNGVLEKFETDLVISEIPSSSLVYEALEIPSTIGSTGIDIDIQRRHVQMQIALVAIGKQLGYRSWVARNDQGIKYGNKSVGQLNGVVNKLEEISIMRSFGEAIRAALHIDCMWFKDGRSIPAIMEVEHSTGVVTGLARMKSLKDQLPDVVTRYVIVAPDEDRAKVLKEANAPQFKDLQAKFLPYSAVEELYYLCQKRNLTPNSVTMEFLDCYMSPCLERN